MAFVASHYLAPIAAIQQRIRTKKATQLDPENLYIRSSAAPIGAAIYATRARNRAAPVVPPVICNTWVLEYLSMASSGLASGLDYIITAMIVVAAGQSVPSNWP
jgi:hypothetical protein